MFAKVKLSATLSIYSFHYKSIKNDSTIVLQITRLGILHSLLLFKFKTSVLIIALCCYNWKESFDKITVQMQMMNNGSTYLVMLNKEVDEF